MAADGWELAHKAVALDFVLKTVGTGTQSYREVQIQVAKLRRKSQEFVQKYSTGLLQLPHKKVSKAQGQAYHRLHLQGKIVDKHLQQMFEEMAVNFLTQRGQKATRNRVRSQVQKEIHNVNKLLHQKYLEVFDVVKKSLPGEQAALPGSGTQAS